MLSRHGTRLDLGTAEDIAELNASKSRPLASHKSSTVVDSSSGGVSGVSPGTGGGGYYTRAAPAAPGYSQVSGNDAYSSVPSVGARDAGGGAFHASPATASTVTTDFAVPVVGGVARSRVGMPSGTLAASGAAAPPHVNLGYTARQRSSGPTMAGIAPAAPPVSGYPQQVLYADAHAGTEERSHSSSTTGRSSTGAGMRAPGGGGGGATGVMPSSRSGMRGTAPAFYRPQMSTESGMYRAGTVAAYVTEGEDREESEEVPERIPEVEHRRSSMHGFFAPPATASTPTSTVAASAAVDSHLARSQQPQRVHGSPYIYHAPRDSAASAHAEAMRGIRFGEQGGLGGDEEDREETSVRPSRVSGRYHFPRSDAP
ncbi:unspecified product [Leishmania tarentolae]|uniref:Unspecified product n=1 Tax=Leishmania tarentolae TaxID=5689 RepID=A0A640KDX1_LEITA|nr:unspecified product [Leishmania tarentolae]